MAGEVTLAKDTFTARLDRLFASWEQPESPWKDIDALFFVSGRQEEDRPAPKTDQLHLWLCGYVFPETLIVITKNRKVFFLTGPKKLSVLKQLQTDSFFFLSKCNEDNNKSNVEQIVDAIQKIEIPEGAKYKIGRLLGKNELAVGAFAQSIEETLLEVAPPEKFESVSTDYEIGLMLAIHDEKSLACCAKAATLSVRLADEILVGRIEDVLDNEAKESHTDISARVEKALDDKKKQEKWKAKYQLEPDCLDIVYVNVQSGNTCDLRPSAQPTAENLNTGPGTIILAVGAKYQDYTGNVIRTLLINASKDKQKVYDFATGLLDYAIAQLKPNKTFNEVYESIKKYVEEKNPTLLEYLGRSFGHTLGIEFRDPNLNINGKSSAKVEKQMVFNVTIGFANIPAEDKKSSYSIWLADTVQIPTEEDAPPIILTKELDRKLKAVNYELSDEPAKESTPAGKRQPDGKTKQKKEASKKIVENGKRMPSPSTSSSDRKAVAESVVLRDRLRSRNKSSTFEESEKLLERQKVLRKRKLAELQARFQDGEGTNFATNKRSVRKMVSLTAYRDASEYPRDLKPNRLHLDLVKEAVLVPLPGFGHVPFHVLTIKNVFCQAEDKKFHTFRIQFQVPAGATKADNNPFPEMSGPNGMFIKELIFRSSNPQLPQTIKSLKDLQKRVKQREETGDTSQDIAVQVPLELNRKGGKRVILKSVMVKTGTQNRRVAGTLEGHVNGLRFSGGRNENIDINYTNIKHAIFQPCDNELVVLIHLHLKNPIVVNKKKAADIQFYTEVGNQTDDLDQRRGRSSYDPDEVAEEQREREQRRRFNAEFKRFVEEIDELARSRGEPLEFDIPFRELGFHGVPKNSSLLMLPTSKCLVQLTEWPVFVLSFSEIEIVSFERVFHGLRQFDMTFIFKDYTRPVQQITTIPTESLDRLKKWLNEIDIVWYESRGNLNWSEILKTIREDAVGFVEDGGFDIFLGDDGTTSNKGKNESETDEEDEDFNAVASESSEEFSEEGNGSDEDSDDSENESESFEGGSSGGSGPGSEDSEDEEGLSWDELEKQAIKDDRKRAAVTTEEDSVDRRNKRRKNR